MVYFKWTVFLIINLVTSVINYPVTPIAVLFATKNNKLPLWLSYLDTPDNTLDGDFGWQTKKPYPKEVNKYQRWVNRFSWLHRNKLYGFGAAVLGIDYDRVNDVYVRDGNRWVNSVPSPGVNGLVKRYLYRDGKLIAWQIYYIRQWKKYPTKCIRLNMGWKLASWEDHNFEYASFVFSPSPWMTFAP